nr:MAG TPA: transcriptional regulator [Caudoviricetes sp.]
MFSNKIGISEKTLRNKINGITDFTWSEVLLIRKLINPKMKLEELFKKEPKNINVIK